MKTIRLAENNTTKVLNKTLNVLKKGGLVIFPSDTVYGLLVDATNEKAVRKLIQFKNRPPGKAISVFVSDFEMMKQYVDLNNNQEKILKEILPGSYTVVLKSRNVGNKNLCSLLESEKGTLGVRIPMYRYIEVLVKKFGRPLTATSANLSSQPPHYSIKTLTSRLPKTKQKLIDLIVDAGPLPRKKPSTVVDLTTSEVKILRKGDIDFLASKTFISKSEKETKRIAKDVFAMVGNKNFCSLQNKPFVFIIQGELGVGKTVFVKGIGELLGINNIISPTYVIYYEYEIKKPKAKSQKSRFIHLDLYNIQEIGEFRYLEIEKLLKPGNVLCFEWGEKAGEIYELLKSKGKIIYVKMKYLSERERKISINV